MLGSLTAPALATPARGVQVEKGGLFWQVWSACAGVQALPRSRKGINRKFTDGVMVQWRGPNSCPDGDPQGCMRFSEKCLEQGSRSDVPQSSPQRKGILTLPLGWVAVDAPGPWPRTGWEKARRPQEAGPAATALSDRSALRVINGPGGAAVSAPRPCRPASGRQPRRPPTRTTQLPQPSLPGEPQRTLPPPTQRSPVAPSVTAGSYGRTDRRRELGYRWMRQRWAALGAS